MTVQTRYEPCEECGAPLDPQQRYCVHCAARRGNGANPSSRYFAAISKRAQRPVARPPAKASSGSRAAAVSFFALLPIAVAIGVVVGRANSGGDEGALLQALREQGSGTVATAGAAGGTAATKAKGKAAKSKQAEKAGKPHEKVEAKTKNGVVHEVANYKPTKKKVEESTKLVEENPEQVGSTYIEAQQNLPDVIPVGGNPNEAPALPTGKGQP